jgi:hypothetical protein
MPVIQQAALRLRGGAGNTAEEEYTVTFTRKAHLAEGESMYLLGDCAALGVIHVCVGVWVCGGVGVLKRRKREKKREKERKGERVRVSMLKIINSHASIYR